MRRSTTCARSKLFDGDRERVRDLSRSALEDPSQVGGAQSSDHRQLEHLALMRVEHSVRWRVRHECHRRAAHLAEQQAVVVPVSGAHVRVGECTGHRLDCGLVIIDDCARQAPRPLAHAVECDLGRLAIRDAKEVDGRAGLLTCDQGDSIRHGSV